MFDCIIVGAGPSGGSAAYHLAKRGRSVLVLEREKLPRYKPCGGGVSPQVAQWFDFDFSPVISLKVNRFHFSWNLGNVVESTQTLPDSLWMVRRDQFDHFLIQKAQAQGAQLRDQTAATGLNFASDHWQVQMGPDQVQGRYLLGADGSKGSVAKWLKLQRPKPKFIGALEAEVQTPDPSKPSPPKDQAMFEFGLVRQGYAWNFPKAEGYSIGVGALPTRPAQNFKTILSDYIQAFDLSQQPCQQWGHPISLWNGHHTLHSQNALLIGEAAAVVDPLTAEGIRPSILSGVKAAEAVDKALAGDGGALADYTRSMQEEWGQDMAWARQISSVFYRAGRMSYEIAIKRPSAPGIMGRIFCGELRYQDVAVKALQRLSAGLVMGNTMK